MLDYSWLQIAMAAFLSLGGIGGAVATATFIAQRIDKVRQDRKEALLSCGTETTELKRLSHTGDADIRTELWRLIEACRCEVLELKTEIDGLEKSRSFSRPAIVNIYKAMRALRKQIDLVDLLILKHKGHDVLATEIEVLRQCLDSLEGILP